MKYYIIDMSGPKGKISYYDDSQPKELKLESVEYYHPDTVKIREGYVDKTP